MEQTPEELRAAALAAAQASAAQSAQYQQANAAPPAPPPDAPEDDSLPFAAPPGAVFSAGADTPEQIAAKVAQTTPPLGTSAEAILARAKAVPLAQRFAEPTAAPAAQVAWQNGATPVEPKAPARIVPASEAPIVDPRRQAAVAAQNENVATAQEEGGAAGQGLARTQGAVHEAKSEELKAQVHDDTKRIEDRKGDMRANIAALQRKVDQAAALGIDPDRLEKGMTPGQQFAFGIAAALSGASAGFNHQTGNAALEQRERDKQSDIAAQREAINSKRLGVADYKDQIAIASKELADLEASHDKVEGKSLGAIDEAGAGQEGTYRGAIARAAGNQGAAQTREQGAERAIQYNRYAPAHADTSDAIDPKEVRAIAIATQNERQKQGLPPLAVDEANDYAVSVIQASRGHRQTGVYAPDFAARPKGAGPAKGATEAGIKAALAPVETTSANPFVGGNPVNLVSRQFYGSEAGADQNAAVLSDAQFATVLRQESAKAGRALLPSAIKEQYGDSTSLAGNPNPERIKQVLANRKAILESLAAPGGAPAPAAQGAEDL